jgi:putative oxidoreductase
VTATMSSLVRAPRLHLVLRLLIGGYFVYASLDKIADPPAFARIVYQWQILGPVLANLVAVTLPWVELLAGLLLIAGVWKRDAAVVIALMLAVFVVAAVSVLTRGIDVENCGCVSVAAAPASDGSVWPPAWMQGVGAYLITRNLLFGAAALLIAFVEPRRASPAPSLA